MLRLQIAFNTCRSKHEILRVYINSSAQIIFPLGDRWMNYHLLYCLLFLFASTRTIDLALVLFSLPNIRICCITWNSAEKKMHDFNFGVLFWRKWKQKSNNYDTSTCCTFILLEQDSIVSLTAVIYDRKIKQVCFK